MKKIGFFIALTIMVLALLATWPGHAQQQVQCPDRPNGDSTNACANTRFVQNNGGGGGGGTVPYTGVTGVPAHSFLGNNTGSAAPAIGLSQAQATAELNPCTSSLQGLVPAPPGTTTTFLRGDCTFAAPGIAGSRYAADYGVVCDGVTDTSITMQTAADASAGYKMILPRGVCVARLIVWPTGSFIVGQGGAGSCATTIKRPAFANGYLFAAVGSNVSDLCFDGNWAGNNINLTTNAATAAGLQTLSFASVSGSVVPGMFIRNLSTEPVQSILHGTTVISTSPTTVLLSIPVQSPGVGNGNVIQFRTSPSAELVTGGPTALTRSYINNVKFINGNWIQLWNCGSYIGACPGGYATVSNSIFDGQGVANAGSAWGIYSNDVGNDLDIISTTVYGYALNGVACNGKTRISNSLFYGNASETPGGQIVCGGDFNISNNTIRNSGTYGSGVEVVGQGTISNNFFQSNLGIAGVYLGQTLFTPDNATTITGNTFQANVTSVLIPNTNGATVTGNHFYTSTSGAITLQGTADYNSIVGNVCQFNAAGISNGSPAVNNYIPAGGNPGC